MSAKTKLNGIEVLISKVLIDSFISHDELKINIAKKRKYDGYQRGLASRGFLDKNLLRSQINLIPVVLLIANLFQTNNYLKSCTNQLLEKLKNEKYNHIFKYNIWGADLTDMQLISKFHKGICFLLRVIDIYSKYVWVIPLKDKTRYYNY